MFAPLRIALASLPLVLSSTTASALPVVFSAGGDTTPASIQTAVDNFRAALGNPNNANAAGPLAGGRREINWDGGGVDTTAPGGTPFDVFLQTRGGRFTTPGTGFFQAPEAGGPQGGLATVFNNATYGTTFNTFSAPRLFTPVASNVTDGFFFIPGTNGGTQATVGGFGAVFTDVDIAMATTLSFFDHGNNLLGTFAVPVGLVPDGSLSFLGVVFNAGEQIFQVRITTGTTALGPTDNPALGIDVVAMDDFLYREPQGVPEPANAALLGAGLLALFVTRRHRHAKLA